KPWARVRIDYAGPFEGANFLVIVGDYSKWPGIFRTDRTTANVTVSILRQVCAKCGMPEMLVSDNGKMLVSSALKTASDTFAHRRITRCQIAKLNDLSTPSNAAFTNPEGKEH
ncbi:Uncharacterized protein K02A2.6, partial [Toxocara canis]